MPRPLCHTWYSFPAAAPLWNLDVYLRWEAAPAGASVYAGFQFQFENGISGYMGLQQYNTGERKALFSIWDTAFKSGTAQPVAQGKRFEHEGSGTMCLMDYPWEPGEEYLLRLWALGTVGQKERWVGRVLSWHEHPAMHDQLIGTIELTGQAGAPQAGYGRVKAQHGLLSFLEYFGAQDGCDGQAYCRTAWRGPYGNNATAAARSAKAGYGDCMTNNAQGRRWPVVIHEGGGAAVMVTLPNMELWPEVVGNAR